MTSTTPSETSMEGAIRFVRLFKAIFATSFLLVWTQQFLLKSLKEDHEIMSEMDPSEILSIPYSLEKLTIAVAVPVAVIILASLVGAPEHALHYVLALVQLTLVSYALLGLCGAQIVDNYQHSGLAALYMAAFLSTSMKDVTLEKVAQTTTSNKAPAKAPVASKITDLLPFHDFYDILGTCRLYGTLIGCIPFQVMQVLDSGIQIQRWPIPIIFGVTYGHSIGTICGLILLSNKSRKTRRQQD